MKRITKIRIPKGKCCGSKCKFLIWSFWCPRRCYLFDETLEFGNPRCPKCLEMYPSGAVFELKEKK